MSEKKDKDIEVVIQSPQGQQQFTFDKTTKISEVIESARKAFGYQPGNFILKRAKDNETLAPERTLESYHIQDGELLLLVPEMGSGV